MRLLILTQWFDPEPTFKGLLFAKEMAKRGFEVEVLTGFPNYPGGKVYPGYRIRWLQREVVDGVRVTRVPLFPSHGRSKVGRVLNYASFMLSTAIYGLFFMRRPDVVYAYHPPLTVGLTAAMLRIFRRIPFVYDIQDLWPDTLSATGMIGNKRILGLVSRFCDFVYAKAAAIVVLSPGFKARLMQRGVPEQKLTHIYNWCDESAIISTESIAVIPDCLTSGFSVLFAGNMGDAQGLESVLSAAEVLQKRPVDANLVFLGDGIAADRLKTIAAAKSLRNVHFLPKVPMSVVGAYLAAAKVLLIHLRDDELFEITIPSKTQAYMAAGKPLLMAVRGDAADLVRKASCGVCVNPGDPEDLADAISKMASMSESELLRYAVNASAFYRNYLSVTAGCDAFASVFHQLRARHD